MDAVYIDPSPRGCGDLVEGGYYLSAADMFSPGGNLWIATYPLGDGLDDTLLCGSMPPRSMLEVNPAATFTRLALIRPEDPVRFTGSEDALYERLKSAVTTHGVFDHVGGNNYTASAFIRELIERGPNRHVPADFARRMAQLVPLPVFFTTRLPVFRSGSEIRAVMDIAESTIDQYDRNTKHFGANWLRPNWGMYAASNQDPGRDHFMLAVIGLMHKVHPRNFGLVKHDPYWQEVRQFMDSLSYEEQPFVASWFLRAIKIMGEGVSYTDADQQAGIVPAIPAEKEDA